MSAGHQHAVGAILKGLHDIKGVDPARAGNPDNPDIGRILNPADPRQVRPGISAPIADDGNNLRFPAFFSLIFSHIFSFQRQCGFIQPVTLV
jgi:hypothetical protein